MEIDSTTPKPFVFVLMPFNDEFKDVYELGIKEACKDAGAYCERVDEQIFDGRIIERIYNQISKADIIITDMTGRNPNVFYETGYAHALGRRVIHITKNYEDIPFDLKDYPHIIYKSISDLKLELVKRVRWCIINPKESLAKADYNLEFYIEGVRIENNPVIDARIIDYGLRFNLKFDYHNISDNEFPSSIRIGVITPKVINRNYCQANIIILPDQRRMHIIKLLEPIYSQSWDSFELRFSGDPSLEIHNSGLTFDCAIQIFTPFGSKEYPFRIKFPKNNDPY